MRHLQRLPLGMSYPEQVARVRELLARSPLSHHDVDVCLDQTGCGAPVGDLVEAAGLKPVRITFTAGHEPIGAGRKWGVPKSIIVSGIDAKLHCGELRFSKQLLEGDALKDEMQNFQRRVSQTGKLLFEHRAGKHDDLIFSIGVCAVVGHRAAQVSHPGTYGALGRFVLDTMASSSAATSPRSPARPNPGDFEMNDKDFSELELRAQIVPQQARWPAPEHVHWQRSTRSPTKRVSG